MMGRSKNQNALQRVFETRSDSNLPILRRAHISALADLQFWVAGISTAVIESPARGTPASVRRPRRNPTLMAVVPDSHYGPILRAPAEK